VNCDCGGGSHFQVMMRSLTGKLFSARSCRLLGNWLLLLRKKIKKKEIIVKTLISPKLSAEKDYGDFDSYPKKFRLARRVGLNVVTLF